MSSIQLWLRAPEWNRLGLVLLHFLWQGACVALLAAVFFRALRQRSAQERYWVGCLALLAMGVLPLVTWWRLSAPLPIGPFEPGQLRIGAPTSRAVGTLAVLSWLWLVGVLGGQLRLLLCYARANQLRRREAELAGPELQALMRDLASRLGMRGAVQLYRSSLARVPIVVGWLRPVVLLPIGAMTQLSRAELEAVLAHELAHLARLDPWINALQSLLESLLFFHPAVWWLSARVREEREFCCDDLAVEVCGDPLRYARALTSLDLMRCEESALVLSSTGGSLMHRIQRLLAHKGPGTGRSSIVAPLLFTSLIAGVAVSSALAGGGGSEPTATPATALAAAQGEEDELEALDRRIQELTAELERLERKLGTRASGPAASLRVPRQLHAVGDREKSPAVQHVQGQSGGPGTTVIETDGNGVYTYRNLGGRVSGSAPGLERHTHSGAGVRVDGQSAPRSIRLGDVEVHGLGSGSYRVLEESETDGEGEVTIVQPEGGHGLGSYRIYSSDKIHAPQGTAQQESFPSGNVLRVGDELLHYEAAEVDSQPSADGGIWIIQSNGQPLTIEKRGGLGAVQYIYSTGDVRIESAPECEHCTRETIQIHPQKYFTQRDLSKSDAGELEVFRSGPERSQPNQIRVERKPHAGHEVHYQAIDESGNVHFGTSDESGRVQFGTTGGGTLHILSTDGGGNVHFGTSDESGKLHSGATGGGAVHVHSTDDDHGGVNVHFDADEESGSAQVGASDASGNLHFGAFSGGATHVYPSNGSAGDVHFGGVGGAVGHSHSGAFSGGTTNVYSGTNGKGTGTGEVHFGANGGAQGHSGSTGAGAVQVHPGAVQVQPGTSEVHLRSTGGGAGQQPSQGADRTQLRVIQKARTEAPADRSIVGLLGGQLGARHSNLSGAL